MRKLLLALTILCFFDTSVFGTYPVYAQDFYLSKPGVRVHLSPEFNPPVLQGIKVYPNDPFHFEFILNKGDFSQAKEQTPYGLKQESTRLIKYFLASLTIPEKDLWVNLSPYEKDRIIPASFGLTEMGRDLLEEDYMLKQITASIIYPEERIGKKFWKRIYEAAGKKFGTTEIPVNTFNKVWIMPGKTVVYENAKTGTAYVIESQLKVMLEQDYLSQQKHTNSKVVLTDTHNCSQWGLLGADIIREIIIPELTKEVNEGKNFAQLRQVYNSLILATWYKKKIKDSILAQVYEDKNKTKGVEFNNSTGVEFIYQRYLQAFKKGAYNYIKEEEDPLTQQIIPRKYFSGGYAGAPQINYAMASDPRVLKAFQAPARSDVIVDIDLKDAAMTSKEKFFKELDDVAVLLREGQYEGAKNGLINALKGYDDRNFHLLADVVKKEGLYPAQKKLKEMDEKYAVKLRAIEKGKSSKLRLEITKTALDEVIKKKSSELDKIETRRKALQANEALRWRFRLQTLQEQKERYSPRYRDLKIEAVGSLLKLFEEKLRGELAEIDRVSIALQKGIKAKEREIVELDVNLGQWEKVLEEGASVEENIAVLHQLSVWLNEQLSAWTAREIPFDQLISRQRVLKEIRVSLAKDAEILWEGVIGYLMIDFEIKENRKTELIAYLAKLGFSTPDDLFKEKLFQEHLGSINIELIRKLIKQAPPEVKDEDLRAYIVGKLLDSTGIDKDQITEDQRQSIELQLAGNRTGLADNSAFIEERRRGNLNISQLKEELRQKINDELSRLGIRKLIMSNDSLLAIIKNPVFRGIFSDRKLRGPDAILAAALEEKSERMKLPLLAAYVVYKMDLEPLVRRIDPSTFNQAMLSAAPNMTEEKFFNEFNNVFLLMQDGKFEDAEALLTAILREHNEAGLYAVADLIDEGSFRMAQKELDKINGEGLSSIIRGEHAQDQEQMEKMILRKIERMEMVEQAIRVFKYNDHRTWAIAKEAKFGGILEEDIKDQEKVLNVLKPKVEAVMEELSGLITGNQNEREALQAQKKILEDNPSPRVVELRSQLEISLSSQDEADQTRVKLLRPLLKLAEAPQRKELAAIDRRLEAIQNEIVTNLSEKEGLASQLAGDENELDQSKEALVQAKGYVPGQKKIKAEALNRAISRLKLKLDQWTELKEQEKITGQRLMPIDRNIIIKHFNPEMLRALIRTETTAVLKSGKIVPDEDFLKRIIDKLNSITGATEEEIREHLHGLNIDVNKERRNIERTMKEISPVISEQKTEPFTVRQEGKILNVVILKNSGNFIDTDHLFDNKGDLTREVAKKLVDVFSNPQAAEKKRKKKNFSGILDVPITTSHGQYGLYVKWYKNQNILAIVGYIIEKTVHKAYQGYPPSFRDHLRHFTDNNIYIADQFNSVYVNKAMLATENTGGIDLTTANMHLETKMAQPQNGNIGGIKFHLDQSLLLQWQNTPGFIPVIINIRPLVNLKRFLDV